MFQLLNFFFQYTSTVPVLAPVPPPIRGQYPGHVITLSQSGESVAPVYPTYIAPPPVTYYYHSYHPASSYYTRLPYRSKLQLFELNAKITKPCFLIYIYMSSLQLSNEWATEITVQSLCYRYPLRCSGGPYYYCYPYVRQ